MNVDGHAECVGTREPMSNVVKGSQQTCADGDPSALAIECACVESKR